MTKGKMTPLAKNIVTGGTGTGAYQPTAVKGTAAITGAPIVQPVVIDVKTPLGVGIGKEPHNRPQIPMTEPDAPNYSGTGTNYDGNIPTWDGGGPNAGKDNN